MTVESSLLAAGEPWDCIGLVPAGAAGRGCAEAAVWGWPFGRPSKSVSCEHTLGRRKTTKVPTQLASVSIKSLGKT